MWPFNLKPFLPKWPVMDLDAPHVKQEADSDVDLEYMIMFGYTPVLKRARPPVLMKTEQEPAVEEPVKQQPRYTAVKSRAKPKHGNPILTDFEVLSLRYYPPTFT